MHACSLYAAFPRKGSGQLTVAETEQLKRATSITKIKQNEAEVQ